MTTPIGFSPDPESELKKLRETVEDLNSVIRNIKDAQTQLSLINLGLAKEHLKAALHFADKAKGSVTEIGKAKAPKKSK